MSQETHERQRTIKSPVLGSLGQIWTYSPLPNNLKPKSTRVQTLESNIVVLVQCGVL